MSHLELARKVENEARPVAFETLYTIFQTALDRVNVSWAKDPGLQDRYDAETANKLMDRIDLLWKGCVAGKARAESFRQAVSKWTNVCCGELS